MALHRKIDPTILDRPLPEGRLSDAEALDRLAAFYVHGDSHVDGYDVLDEILTANGRLDTEN